MNRELSIADLRQTIAQDLADSVERRVREVFGA
jgi:hypothetical protein